MAFCNNFQIFVISLLTSHYFKMNCLKEKRVRMADLRSRFRVVNVAQMLNISAISYTVIYLMRGCG
jgi:hypothetical protein